MRSKEYKRCKSKRAVKGSFKKLVSGGLVRIFKINVIYKDNESKEK